MGGRTVTSLPTSLPLSAHPDESLTSLLAATQQSLTPLLTSRHNLRALSSTLQRLSTAFSLAATADLPPTSLFDAGALADVRMALAELRQIAARARQVRSRPRIRVDRRSQKDPVLAPDERKRVDIVANRLDTLLQVALWRHRHVVSEASSVPTRTLSQGKRRALATRLNRGKNDALIRMHSFSNDHDPMQDALQSRPWMFSIIESPITPLQSRSIHDVAHGCTVMALWRSARVSVKIMRKHRALFVHEADYLHGLGQSENIPTLLGAHWEQNGERKGKAANVNDGVGYLIMQVLNGTSLDTIVREGKLEETVLQIRVLDRIVAALLYAQKLNPAVTHQDLHPGNILLVPADPSSSSLKTAMSSNTTLSNLPTPASPPPPAATAATMTPLSTVISDDLSPVVSQTTLAGSSTGAEAEFAMRSVTGPKNRTRTNAIPAKALVTARVRTPITKAPKIPKIEDVSEALSVLERVALHNKLDAYTETNGAHLQDRQQPPLTQMPGYAKRLVLGKPRAPAASPFASSSVSRTTTSVANSSAASTDGNVVIGGNEMGKEITASLPTAPEIAAFNVKVMDFPPSAEAQGDRKSSSWDTNEALAGYCAPEKVTSIMWRKIQRQREEEREREYERGRRHAGGRTISGGHRSPRALGRRRSSNGTEGADHRASSRSSSGTHRRQFDSEAYALFGDDHMVPLSEADDTSGTVMTEPSSPPDRSGRHVVARGPSAFKEYEKTKELVHAQVADRLYQSQNASQKGYVSEDLTKDWALPMPAKTGSNDGSEKTERLLRRSKSDVWSVGWLLYYMCTGKHPPSDAWARQVPLTDRDMRKIPVECVEIIEMCVEPDVDKRACIRDVKRRIDSILQGLMFGRGLALLDSDRQAAFVLLDKAVGMKTSNVSFGTNSSLSEADEGTPGTNIRNSSANTLNEMSRNGSTQSSQEVLGLNGSTRQALASLPLAVVRRVEWEAAARYLERSNDEIARLRGALVNEKWNKADVTNGAAAIEYLSKRSKEGVASAQSALGWVYRWGAGGIVKDVQRAMVEWEQAAELGDPEACNGLGLLYHHGRDEIKIDGEQARRYYQVAVDQGYPAAAVNLGVMLHDGAAGLPPDGVAARGLYEMACRHGDAIAANNLGLLLQHGAPGVKADAAAAVRAYEMAIERNERHHACRNLGELLWNGGDGVSRSRANAVEYFAHALARGDASSRRSACSKLRKLVKQSELEGEETMPQVLLGRCHRLLAAYPS